ncbi:MAG: phosphodiester glycosidase family protein, partial [Candidatus Kapaibacterium sp.]
MKKTLLTILFLSLVLPSISQSAAKNAKRQSSKGYPSIVLSDSLLSDGIRYSNIKFGSRKLKISANILEIDLTNPNFEVAVYKAKNNISELDKLQEIIRFTDTTENCKTLAAINGSFWKAVRNYPIGACIKGGVVIEQNPYKQWSGLYLDKNGIPYIDNFKLTGSVSLHNGKKLILSNVNRRRDSIGVVLYNSYGGNVIPHINLKTLDKMIESAYTEMLKDTSFLQDDSTEYRFSYEEFEQNIIENARNEQLESSIKKALIEFIDTPGINRDYRGIINYIDTGIVKINSNQAVLSLGFNLPPDIELMIGDTLTFNFSTNNLNNIEFEHALTATPRLVRKGVARHEAQSEGSRSRRFINGRLGRTAIGYNKEKSKLYLVTIDHSNRRIGRKGSTLGELAQIMKQIGCY